MPRPRLFSPKEDILVLKVITWAQARDLAQRLGRTTQPVCNRRRRLRLRGTLSAEASPAKVIGPHLDRPDWFEENLDPQSRRGTSVQKRKD